MPELRNIIGIRILLDPSVYLLITVMLVEKKVFNWKSFHEKCSDFTHYYEEYNIPLDCQQMKKKIRFYGNWPTCHQFVIGEIGMNCDANRREWKNDD